MKLKTKKEDLIINLHKAAKICFAKYGFDKTTLDDIGKIVGLKKSSLYYYYKSKDELFYQVVLEDANLFMQKMHAQCLKKKGIENQLQFYFKERISYYSDVLKYHQLEIDSLLRIEPAFEKLYNETEKIEKQFIETILKQVVLNNKLLKTDIKFLTHNLFTCANAFKHEVILEAHLKMEAKVDYKKAIKNTNWLITQIITNK